MQSATPRVILFVVLCVHMFSLATQHELGTPVLQSRMMDIPEERRTLLNFLLSMLENNADVSEERELPTRALQAHAEREPLRRLRIRGHLSDELGVVPRARKASCRYFYWKTLAAC